MSNPTTVLTGTEAGDSLVGAELHDRLYGDPDNDLLLGAAGDLTAAQLVSGVTALDADDCLLYDVASGTLYCDADGSGEQAAVAFLRVGGGAALAASDISVV